MGLLSQKIQREELNPGDHIYTWRLGYSYSHHGIYVGDGKLVHLTRAPGLIIFSSSDESSPSHHSGEDRVVCCSIEEFLCGGDLYLYEYGVMTALFIIKRGGTCTSFTSDPPKDVLHRASILLEKGFGDYHLFENNCEDFAIYCKTSLLRVDGPNRGISGQIKFLVAVITVVIFSPIGSLPSALALVIHGVLYFSLRLMYNKDDVKKVAVENLDDLSNQQRTIRTENRRTSGFTSGFSLSAGYYIVHTILTFNIWSWTPTSRILLWIRFLLLFSSFQSVVSDHLTAHRINLKVLGEHVAWIIWVLGCWYWRSESRLYFWTKLCCLYQVLLLFVSDQPRTLNMRIYLTANVLGFWYWTPESTILLWIRLVFLHFNLWYLVSIQLFNDRFKLGRFFFACFVIQSAVLFMGLVGVPIGLLIINFFFSLF